MPTGLQIPVRVDERGRAAVESNESKNTLKILVLALSEGEDDNSFQTLGIDNRIIYSVKTSAFRGKAIQAVNRILAKFTELVRVDDSTIQFDESVEAEVILSFKYIDLLTNKEEEFKHAFKK